MLDKFKIDDVVGAIPVHLFAGIWGTMVVPATNADASYVTQFVSIIIVGVFVVVTSGIVWTILKSTMGIRVGEEEEVAGLDVSELVWKLILNFQKGKQSLIYKHSRGLDIRPLHLDFAGD